MWALVLDMRTIADSCVFRSGVEDSQDGEHSERMTWMFETDNEVSPYMALCPP